MDEPEENAFPGSWEKRESDQSIVQKWFPFLAAASQFKPHTSSPLSSVTWGPGWAQRCWGEVPPGQVAECVPSYLRSPSRPAAGPCLGIINLS